MDPIQEAFEKDLISKLQYKTSSRVGLENVLLKIFKFFDLDGTGFLKKTDFIKAIAKAGVILSDIEVQNHLFNLYSKNQQTVNYKDFINLVTGGQQNGNEQAQLTGYQGKYQDKIQHLNSQGFQIAQTGQGPEAKGNSFQEQAKYSLDLIRNKLSLRGSQGLLSFARALKSAQGNQNTISSQQFFQIVKEQRLDVDQNSQILIFMQGDQTQSGQANFQDIIAQIKGTTPIYRQSLLRQVFDSFGLQEVSPQQLFERYNSERHPDVRHLNKRPNELGEEFLAAIDTYQFLLGNVNFDLGLFIDFYHYFGFNINNDELFRSIIVSVWDLDQQSSPRRNVANKAVSESQQSQGFKQPQQQQAQLPRTPIKQSQKYPDEQSQSSKANVQRYEPQQSSQQQSQQQSPQSKASQSSQSQASTTQMRQVELIVQRIKNRLATRGAKGFISMYRAFRMLDLDKDGMINLAAFRKAIRDHRIDVTDQEIDLVFAYFDRDQSGLIDLWGMMFVLKGELNQQRSALVEQVFEKIDKDNDSIVTIAELKAAFLARNHPDVKSGRKQDDEINLDYVESLEMLHNINGGFGNDHYTKDEFFEYFTNYSASVSDDKYFENILYQVFKLTSEQSLHSNYAGGKRTFEPDHKKGYLQDHHRQVVSGGSVSQNAPFGTFQEPTDYPQRVDRQTPNPKPNAPFQQSSSFNIFKPLDDSQRRIQTGQSSQSSQPPLSEPVSNVRNKLSDPVQQVKGKIIQRGLRGIFSLQKKFRLFDRSALGTVTQQEFFKVLNDLRLGVSDRDVFSIFKQFEVQESGVMNYEDFVKSIQGTMSLRKFNILQTIFDCFVKDKNLNSNFDELRDTFNARAHPDVKVNKRREEDILQEFLETFEDHHQIFTGTSYIMNPLVSFEEFLSYYNNQNAYVEDDGNFEQALSVWPVNQRRK